MTTVNFFHNLQAGAPQLDGLAGSLISVLDAALVNGWGLQTATISVTAGVATLTTPSTHVFLLHQVVLVEGATPSALNGRKRVLPRTGNTITFAAPGVPDGAATGTIQVRLAPAGWSKVFSGTNKAVYRANNVEGARMFLRVDDTVGRNARVVGYETMGDVDTGEMPFPTGTQVSGGGWWPKSNSATNAARSWTVVADDRTVYLRLSAGTSNGTSGAVWGFGDFASYKAGDAFRAFLAGDSSDTSAQGSPSARSFEWCGIGVSGTQPTQGFVARSFSGVGGAVQVSIPPESYARHDVVSGAGYGVNPFVGAYPNGPDNSLVLSRKIISEPSSALRGVIRGLYVAPQNCNGSFNDGEFVQAGADLNGRVLLAVKCGSPAAAGSQGVVFFDITGPWSV